MGHDVKLEKFLPREELPAFFRALADALESDQAAGEFACVERFDKLKISVRDQFGQLSLKMKTKPADECEPGDAGTDGVPGMGDMKPKYKFLKKRMKSSFGLIFKMLHEGQVPPETAVDSFVADSRLMCTYPGNGDEYYEEYLAAVAAFEAAFSSGDADQMLAGAVTLAGLKGRCHAKYD